MSALRLGLLVAAGASIVGFIIIQLWVADRPGSRLYVFQSVLSLLLFAVVTVTMVRFGRAFQAPQSVTDRAPEAGRKQYGHIMAFLRITRLMGSSATLQETLDGITQTALDLFEAEQTSVLLFNEKTRRETIRRLEGLVPSNTKAA